jgi:hypothetical protein
MIEQGIPEIGICSRRNIKVSTLNASEYVDFLS